MTQLEARITAETHADAVAGRSEPAPADTAHVLGLIGGYQVSPTVYAAAALKLPDIIAAGVDTSDSLAARTGAVPARIHRLLRSLVGYGLFTQTGPHRWGLTAAGQLLRSDIPDSLHGLAVMWNEEHYDAFRGLTATILDLPHVLPAADQLLTAAGLRERVTLVAGDFFDSVPADGDVYLLSMIIHDWADREAIRLLHVIRRAIPATGRLLVVGAVLPACDVPHFGKLLDLTMMAMLTGRERTEDEFTELLRAAGFTLERVVETPSPTSLIQERPA